MTFGVGRDTIEEAPVGSLCLGQKGVNYVNGYARSPESGPGIG